MPTFYKIDLNTKPNITTNQPLYSAYPYQSFSGLAAMRLFLAIPLFLYLLIAANVLMMTGPIDQSMMNVIVTEFMLPSTRQIIITVSDVLILCSLFFLYIETFKATRTSTASIIDHVLSLAVFLIFFVEFLVVPRLGNTTFLIIMMGALMDVVMGFTVTISTARRDFTSAHVPH